MSKKYNYVLAGDYKGCRIFDAGEYKDRRYIFHIATDPNASSNQWKQKYNSNEEFVEINKEAVVSWELMTEESQKSLSSTLTRGLVGGALLGPIGLIAGGLTGRNDKTYHVIVNWKDGKKSIFQLTDVRYKTFLSKMF
jgi:hypothetical protein